MQWSTRNHNPDNHNLDTHRQENLKFTTYLKFITMVGIELSRHQKLTLKSRV
jgi:hypothetical protein